MKKDLSLFDSNNTGTMWSGNREGLIADMMQLGRELGLDAEVDPKDKGTLRDPLSHRRLKLVVDTQVAMAYGYGQWLSGQDPVALDLYPAQELIRVTPRRVPRNWAQRWADAGGQGYGGREVAKKGDAVWVRISRFGSPFPPFDFSSGMGVEEVERADAEELGVIAPDELVESEAEKFRINDKLDARIPGLNQRTKGMLRYVFGKQIEIDGETVRWRAAKPEPVPKPKPKAPRQTKYVEGYSPEPKETDEEKETLQGWKQGLRMSTASAFEKALQRAASSLPDASDTRATSVWERALNRLIQVPEKRRREPVMKVLPGVSAEIVTAAQAGAAAVARYVHPSKSQITLYLDRSADTRGSYKPDPSGGGGTVKLHETHKASRAAHEIMHAIEQNNIKLLTAAVKFRARRHGSAPLERLRDLYPGVNYRVNEVTMRDKFAERGGSHYDGKLYRPFGVDVATEIITQGIERLINGGAAKFLHEDADYFIFLIKALRLP